MKKEEARIPLTEDIILILGFQFEKFQHSCYFTKNEVKIKFNPYNLENTFSFLFQGGDIGCMEHIDIRLEYVHQLQNLYFSLTQEELTFNLK